MYIEIVSIDKVLADRVTRELERILKDLSFSVKGVTSSDVLFSEAIKVVKTYPAISIEKNTMILLEAARHYQIYHEQIEADKTPYIFKSGSFLVETMIAMSVDKAKKLMARFLIRRFPRKPDYIIYLETDLRAFLDRRRGFDPLDRVEDRLNGVGGSTKFKKFPIILEKINSQYGIKSSIIKTEDNPKDLTSIIEQIVADLIANKLIGNQGQNENSTTEGIQGSGN